MVPISPKCPWSLQISLLISRAGGMLVSMDCLVILQGEQGASNVLYVAQRY